MSWGHTFNGRVIFVDEMTLDQLNCKTRFTDTTSTDDHQFVLSQKLLTNMVNIICAQGKGDGTGEKWTIVPHLDQASSHEGTGSERPTLDAIVLSDQGDRGDKGLG